MDRQHRDRMAFLRICSGRFTKDMIVHHARLDRELRMTRPHRLFGRDRETVESAFPGDVVGVINPGVFLIGDTLAEVPGIAYPPMPAFQPSQFARLRCVDVARRKQFDRGLMQLQEEGVIRRLTAVTGSRDPDPRRRRRPPVQHRREPAAERVRREGRGLPAAASRGAMGRGTKIEDAGSRAALEHHRVHDATERYVLLFEGDWELRFAEERVPELQLETLA